MHIFDPKRSVYANYSYTTLSLLFLSTAPPSPLSSLNTLLIRLNLPTTLLQSTKHASRRLPGPLEISGRRLAQQMHLNQVSLKRTLQRDDALDEQRVGVLEVDVHDGHHADAHELRLVEPAQLLLVVGLDGGGDGFRLFGAAHWRGFDVFEDCSICTCYIVRPWAVY